MSAYLALGDSYTCGEAVDPEQAFPRQLACALRAGGVNIDDPRIVAATGWTTDELQQAIKKDNDRGTYDLVTLLIGVNNQYRGIAKGYTLEGYRREFVGLLQKSIQFARGIPSHVIVMSIPDWGAMPFAEGKDRQAIAADIDAYNAANKMEAIWLGARYVDITPISRHAQHDASLVAEDGLHPSGKMYLLWVEALLSVARTVLSAH